MSPSMQTQTAAPQTTHVAEGDDDALPLRGGCWVASGEGTSITVARVKACYRSQGEILLDLYIYDRDGNNLGRTSPVMGGPRSFEPCCAFEGWRRIEEPAFPLRSAWIPSPGDPSRKTMGYGGIKTIPFGRYLPRKPSPPPVAKVASASDYNPELEASARRMSAQELRDVAKSLPAESRVQLLDRATRLEAEADRIAPRR
jgi:hypothetical protein